MSLKIFTNAPFQKIGGIAHHVSSFTQFLEEQKKRVSLVGIDVIRGDTPMSLHRRNGRFTLRSAVLPFAPIRDVVLKASTLKDVIRAYEPVIDVFQRAIAEERPDVIVINGTYYIPWCLLLAAREQRIPILVHYHGSLTKETVRWDEKPRTLFRGIEKTFDDRRVFYIFPSQLAKEAVEKDVFRHTVRHATVLPNPVPLHFFQERNMGRKENVGMVARWAAVKNPQFSVTLARYARRIGSTLRMNVLTDLASDHSLRERFEELVRFRNPGSHERLLRFYQSMGVVVSPSHFETYGNVAQEALATATPALVNSNMGVAETFRALGLDDWIIDFNSVRSVYDRVKAVSGQTVPRPVLDELRRSYTPNAIFSRFWNLVRTAT